MEDDRVIFQQLVFLEHIHDHIGASHGMEREDASALGFASSFGAFDAFDD